MCEQALPDSRRLIWIIHGSLVLLLLFGSACHRGDSLSRSTEGARAEAKKWQADAQLVQIHALNFVMFQGNPPVMKSGPPQMVTFYFFSPSTHRGFHVDAMPQGLQPHPDELPSTPFTLPLPDNFGSLDEALAQVRKGNGSDILVTEADLRVYWNAGGQPERTAWKIAFSQGSGITQTSLTQYVDAASGALVTVEDRSVPPPNSGMTEGTPPTDTDFAAFRQAADQNVATRGAGFKLYAADLGFRLPEPVYDGPEKPGSKVKLSMTHFEYARSTPTVNWESVDVELGTASGIAAEAVLGASIGPVVQQVPPNAIPHLFPDDLPDPEPFLRELRESFPKQDQHTPRGLYEAGGYNFIEGAAIIMTLAQPTARAWLGRQGEARPMFGEPPREEQYGFFTSTAPRDRWEWWTIVEHARFVQKRGHPPGSNDPLEGWEQFIYIDAATGARSTRCTTPSCIYNCGLAYQPPPPMPPVPCE